MTMQENAKHSPRLSFSHDFCHFDSIPIEQSPLPTPSDQASSNFDFSIPGGVNSGESSWSAEELFSDGKILPTEIKKRPEPEKNKPGLCKPETNPIGDVKPVMEIGLTATSANMKSFLFPYRPGRPKPETNPMRNVKPVHEIEEVEEDEERPNTKPFWGLKKRSECLSSDIGLPLLSHTPSGSNFEQTETMKLQGLPSSSSNCSSQKKPLKKKNYGGYSYGGNGGGIKVNSFLDVIPSGSLFGLGSIIVRSGSDKNKNMKRAMFFYW